MDCSKKVQYRSKQVDGHVDFYFLMLTDGGEKPVDAGCSLLDTKEKETTCLSLTQAESNDFIFFL